MLEVESPELARGCDEGLFETLDYSKIGNKADFVHATRLNRSARIGMRNDHHDMFACWQWRGQEAGEGEAK